MACQQAYQDMTHAGILTALALHFKGMFACSGHANDTSKTATQASNNNLQKHHMQCGLTALEGGRQLMAQGSPARTSVRYSCTGPNHLGPSAAWHLWRSMAMRLSAVARTCCSSAEVGRTTAS
jgi:hypothetical protein